MDKVIVFYRKDGVSVVHPAPKNIRKGETETKFLKRTLDRFLECSPDFKSLKYDIIDKKDLPKSREDRGAWEGKPGEGIKVNKTKAAKIKKEREHKVLIDAEKKKVLEDMAIKNLKNKGVL